MFSKIVLDRGSWKTINCQTCQNTLGSISLFLWQFCFEQFYISSNVIKFFFEVSEDAFEFPIQAFDVAYNPWEIFVFNSYNFIWDGFLSSRDDGISNVISNQ